MHSDIRKRVLERFRGPDVPARSVMLLEGGRQRTRYNTDNEWLFRQESNFHYLFGVSEGDYFGAIEVDDGASVLFMPRLPPEYAVWMGAIATPEDIKHRYGVDRVMYTDEIVKYFSEYNPDVIYTLRGTNTDSWETLRPASFAGMDRYRVDHGRLWDVVSNCRVQKTEDELEIMRYVNRVSSYAHFEVMKATKPGMYEYELESLFHHIVYAQGACRVFAYTPIAASGPNAAVLHYGHAGAPNNRRIEENDIILLDLGAEYYCYASDITRSYPASGRFSPVQKDMFEIVAAARDACFGIIRAGVCWADVHRLANRTIVQELLQRGYLKGNLDDMVAAHVGALFMPHGLGHLLGLDTHDVGGYPRGTARIQLPGLKSLRTTRTLEPNQVITVEPGCYFIESLLVPAFKDPKYSNYLVEDKLRPMIGLGGVRLEDNIVIREGGFENLSSGPRTVAEIEAVMAARA